MQSTLQLIFLYEYPLATIRERQTLLRSVPNSNHLCFIVALTVTFTKKLQVFVNKLKHLEFFRPIIHLTKVFLRKTGQAFEPIEPIIQP